MKTLSLFSFISAILCFLTITSNAGEQREHKAHVHGAAKLDISIEKNEIEADLDISGMDLVGFEGKSRSKENQDNLKKVTDLLTKDYSLFLIDETAGCTVTKRKLESESHDKDHTDYEYEIEYKCKDASKIKTLDVNIFRDIETLNEVTAQVVTEKVQKEIKLNRTSSKIQL